MTISLIVFVMWVMSIIVVLLCMLPSHRKRELLSHSHYKFASNILHQGWGYIVYSAEDSRIIYNDNLDGYFTRGQLKHIDLLCEAVDVQYRTIFKNFLMLPSTEARHDASVMVRLMDGSMIECNLSSCVWNHVPAFMCVIRNVSTAYSHMQSKSKENDALKAETHWHSTLLNHVEFPMWVRSEDLSIQYCNLAYMMLAEESDSALGSESMPELFSGMKELSLRAQKAKTNQSQRFSLVLGGKRFLYEVTEIYSSSGRNMVGYAKDITHLKSVEIELEKQLTTLEDVLDSSSSAMTIYDSESKLQFYNQAYVRMWGMEESFLVRHPTFAETLEYLRELRKLPEQINFPVFKQQRLKIFSESNEPHEEIFYLPDGRTIRNVTIPHSRGGILFIDEDVTDRLALERSYNTSIAVQRETLDNLHEGVAVFAENGKLQLKNPVFSSIWGLSEKSFPIGTHVAEFMESTKHLYHVTDWKNFKASFIAKLQSRKLHTSRIERTDGAVLDYSAVPLPDGGVLLTFIDMTAATLVERSLREKNDALEAGDKLKREFLANMSYELRSPLTSISGFAEMLLQQYVGEFNPIQKEYIEGIFKSSQDLMRLINDILDLSSIEAGYMTLNMREFDAKHVLHATILSLAEKLKDKKIVARIEVADNVGTIKADETRIRQALTHLLSNAAKYSNSQEDIILGANRVQDGVNFWVKDTGIGIAEEEQKAVFKKFYRGNAGIRKSGTGLGLSMVKNFIELHGGHVTLESVLGKGTTVTCFIPNTLPAVPEATPSAKDVITHGYELEGSPTLH
jgi:signal transduction histidine kinase